MLGLRWVEVVLFTEGGEYNADEDDVGFDCGAGMDIGELGSVAGEYESEKPSELVVVVVVYEEEEEEEGGGGGALVEPEENSGELAAAVLFGWPPAGLWADRAEPSDTARWG